MPIPNEQDWIDAKEDLDDLESIINDSAPATITTRLGTEVSNMARLEQLAGAAGALQPATQADAIAGTNNTNYMTPLRTAEAINSIGVIRPASYADVRSIDISTIADGQVVTVTDSGIAGDFVLRNVPAHGLTDNNGTTIVINSDWYAERIYSGIKNITWFGVEATGTDDTANMVAFLATLDAATEDTYEIPFGFKYNRSTVINSMPAGVVFYDLSSYDYDSTNETTKRYGLVSKDSAPNDTHWAVDSGHHAIMTLNNYGLAGSTSASERKGSLLWATGNLQNSGNDKRGFREAAFLQFTQSPSSNFWVFQLRAAAPWDAIANDWEDWQSGESIAGAGIYRRGQDNFYVSAGGGTTGATIPSHTSGTVSDGGVSWTWVSSSDISIFNIDQHNRILFGSGSFGETFRHKVSSTDPGGGSYIAQRASTGISKDVQDQLRPTDASGNEVAVPFWRASDVEKLRLMKSDGSTEIASFTDDSGVTLSENARRWQQAANGDTTPSVEGVATLYTENTSATSITAFDDGDDGQVVDIVIVDTNTTLVSSATFLLEGGANLVTPAVYTVVTMQKVPTSVSDRWIEVSRSVK